MKNTGKVLLGGLLIMAVSVYLEVYVLNLINRANGPCGLDKVVLTDRVGSARDRNSRLDLEDMEYLKKKLSGRRVSYLMQQQGQAEGNRRTASVKILGTDSQQVNFCALDFIKGGMWTPEAEQEGQRVAVIGNNLARTLYGSEDVVGMPINIEGKTFLINGVISTRAGILNEWTGDGISELYIPGAALFDLSADSQIREIDIEIPRKDSVRVSGDAAHLLTELGLPADLTAYDYHQVRVLMEQVPKIQRFILGIIGVWSLLQIFKNRTRSLLLKLRSVSTELDLAQILAVYRQQIGLHLGFSAVLCLVIWLIWKLIKFTPYIPSAYLPDNFINISYFTEVIKLSIHAGQTGPEYYQPRPEMEMGLVRHISRFLYYFIWPLGLAMLLNAWSQIKKESGDYQ